MKARNNLKTKIFSNKKRLTIAIFLVAVLSLTIGYATFQSELMISPHAYVNPDANSFKVVFSSRSDELDTSAIVPTTSTDIEASNAVINSNSLSIKRMNVTFTEPNQSASYVFYVLNQGDYKAFLNKVEFEDYESYNNFKKCTAIDSTKQDQVDKICQYIKLELKINDTDTYDTTTDIQNHILEQNNFEKITINISYEENNIELDTDFNVDFGIISLIYSTVGDYNPDNNTTSSSKNNSNNLINKILMAEANTDSIKKSRLYVQNKVAPNFANPATSDEGLFSTTDEDGIVYYYRGAVDNNHVIFANFCWKIVRTTGTGGVKIIYDGLPKDGVCNNSGDDTNMTKSAFNTSSNSPAHFGYMYDIVYQSYRKDITSLTGPIIFGNDIIYNAETNMYTLKDTYTLSDTSNWKNELTTISNKYHYTCFNSSDSCQVVNYVSAIYSNDANYCTYFALTDGKNQIDILEETLTNSSNSKDSTAKSSVDSWFKKNLINYQQYLEDTIFCNDRTYYNFEVSGWNKDYSNYNKWLYFSSAQRLQNREPSLICPKLNDKFTVNYGKGNGDLTYPVGLITADEIALAGGLIWSTNTSYYLYNGTNQWTLSPSYFYNSLAGDFIIGSASNFTGSNVSYLFGIRPVVSLKAGIQVTSGDGSKNSPYIIKS